MVKDIEKELEKELAREIKEREREAKGLSEKQKQMARKMLKGGFLMPKKSEREVARKLKTSRYKVTKALGQEFMQQERFKREQTKELQKTGKKLGKTAKTIIKKIKSISRPYTKTQAWYKTRMTPRGRYRNPQEYEGYDSDRRGPEPKFHVGTFSAQKTRLLDLRQKPLDKLPLKGPIHKEIEGEFMSGSASNLLDLSNGRGQMGEHLLDIRKKDEV